MPAAYLLPSLNGHEFAHRPHRLALCVDGERGVGVDADALLGCQRAAVFQYQLHVAVDDDALSVGETAVQHIPAVVQPVLGVVAYQTAGEHGGICRAVGVFGDGFAVTVHRVVDVFHGLGPCPLCDCAQQGESVSYISYIIRYPSFSLAQLQSIAVRLTPCCARSMSVWLLQPSE